MQNCTYFSFLLAEALSEVTRRSADTQTNNVFKTLAYSPTRHGARDYRRILKTIVSQWPQNRYLWGYLLSSCIRIPLGRERCLPKVSGSRCGINLLYGSLIPHALSLRLFRLSIKASSVSGISDTDPDSHLGFPERLSPQTLKHMSCFSNGKTAP